MSRGLHGFREAGNLCNSRLAFPVLALFLISVLGYAQHSFVAYDDIKHLLPFLTEASPAELKSTSWNTWVAKHDADIRQRLLRGDEDSIINWLLFGTSFTSQSRSETSRRIKDFIAALSSPRADERRLFARAFFENSGYRFDSQQERTKLERHLQVEVERVFEERKQYIEREAGFRPGDIVEQLLVQSTLFRDRGLSLDTSILPSFAIEQTLAAMQTEGFALPNTIHRVAIIGPGLDFADKNSGYDFYPVQTLQPFTSIDSLVRLGLASSSADIEVITLDISPRVNEHIRTIRERARAGAAYELHLPTDPGSSWTPPLMGYWKTAGDRIGSQMRASKDARGIKVGPEVVMRVTPADFNVVTEKWKGPPFDLVIATNIFVYYDKFDQLLGFANIESMLRPGGFFLTNNAIVEVPVSRLRSIGVTTVRHTEEKTDHVFWYRLM